MKILKQGKRKEAEEIFLELLSENRRNKYVLFQIYCINIPGCGYEGGRKGDGHVLDYVTFITLPNSSNIITMFPSDEVVLRESKKEIERSNSNDRYVPDDHDEL